MIFQSISIKIARIQSKKEDRFSVLFLFSRLFSATKRKKEGQKIIFRFERKNRENNRKNQLDFVTKKTLGILSEK